MQVLLMRRFGGSKMGKTLYIFHSTEFNYGATRSLRYILKNERNPFDVIAIKDDFKETSEEEIRAYTGDLCENVYRYYLKRDLLTCYEPSFWGELTEHMQARKARKLALEQEDSIKIKELIQKNGYDYVYLNSLILYGLVEPEFNYIIHVREVDISNEEKRQYTQKQLEKANGIIFIGGSEFERFQEIQAPNMVLINPFDMECVKDVDGKLIKNKYGIQEDDIVLSILGEIALHKGVDFLIDCLKKSSNKKLKLLIVGSLEMSNITDRVIDMAEGCENIIFCGETSTPEDFYAISDYVLRADAVLGVGRTVFEALYAGCKVIMQGDAETGENPYIPEEFRKDLITYKCRNKDSLTSVLDQLEKTEKVFPEKMSNVPEYMERFFGFIDEVIYNK